MTNEQRDGLLIDLADSLKREDELRERCAFYERQNSEQAAILNCVIAERDDYRAALEICKKEMQGDKWDALYIDGVLAKHSTEDEIERARRLV